MQNRAKLPVFPESVVNGIYCALWKCKEMEGNGTCPRFPHPRRFPLGSILTSHLIFYLLAFNIPNLTNIGFKTFCLILFFRP